MQIEHVLPLEKPEHPLELLFACHHKVRHFSNLSGKLAVHLHEQGADDEARQCATSILRYFELALPSHHADEEEDVFPALRRLNDVHLHMVLDKLHEEHLVLDRMWKTIRPWLSEISEGGTPFVAPLVLPHFIRHYQEHTRIEEGKVFPAINRLPLETIEQIAKRMCARRGLITR